MFKEDNNYYFEIEHEIRNYEETIHRRWNVIIFIFSCSKRFNFPVRSRLDFQFGSQIISFDVLIFVEMLWIEWDFFYTKQEKTSYSIFTMQRPKSENLSKCKTRRGMWITWCGSKRMHSYCSSIRFIIAMYITVNQ